MKPACQVIVTLFLVLTNAVPAWSESTSLLLQGAAYYEETVGDLDAAIAIYEQIIDAAEAAQPHLAHAHFHLAACYLKKGQTDKASDALRRLVERFPRQTEIVAKARERLAELDHASQDAGGKKRPLVMRRVWQEAEDTEDAPSPDGRWLSFVDWKSGDLAIRELATGENRRLTNKGTWNESSAFAMYKEARPLR